MSGSDGPPIVRVAMPTKRSGGKQAEQLPRDPGLDTPAPADLAEHGLDRDGRETHQDCRLRLAGAPSDERDQHDDRHQRGGVEQVRIVRDP
jgi:hypothetical protein